VLEVERLPKIGIAMGIKLNLPALLEQRFTEKPSIDLATAEMLLQVDLNTCGHWAQVRGFINEAVASRAVLRSATTAIDHNPVVDLPS
jgi:hypothetical protein